MVDYHPDSLIHIRVPTSYQAAITILTIHTTFALIGQSLPSVRSVWSSLNKDKTTVTSCQRVELYSSHYLSLNGDLVFKKNAVKNWSQINNDSEKTL